MRVSTALISKYSVDALNQQQGKLTRLQAQVSTGQRMLAPSDDPYGSARALNLSETIMVTDQLQVNGAYADDRLATADGVLENLTGSMQRVRELAIGIKNDTNNAQARSFVAAEVRQLYDQIAQLANTTDANNEFLFSGFQGNTKPFTPNAVTGAMDYNGDSGQRFAKIGPSTQVPISDSGDDLLIRVRNGNGTFVTQQGAANTGAGIIDPGSVTGTYIPDDYTVKFIGPTVPPNAVTDPVEYYIIDKNSNIVEPAGYVGQAEAVFQADVAASITGGTQYEEGAALQGLGALGVTTSISGAPAAGDTFQIRRSDNQDVFTTLNNMITALGSSVTTDSDRARMHNDLNRVLTDLDQSMSKVLDVQARVGARLNTVARQKDINDSYGLQLKQTISLIQDLDYAEAVTQLNIQIAGLEAAQKTYQKIQGLSLFNFIN